MNNHPPETRKVRAFLDPEETISHSHRKEVSSREVLTSYEKAKIHALNYMRRKEFPNNPAVYQAICYWAAGLLSEKAHFKDENIELSTLLIEEARNLLDPLRNKGEDFFTVSGEEFSWDAYLRSEESPRPRRKRVPYKPPSRDDDRWGGEPKEHLIHGHFHKRIPHKPKFDHCKPPKREEDYDLRWISSQYKNKYEVKVEPIVIDEGELGRIKAYVTKQGKPCNDGTLFFYMYE